MKFKNFKIIDASEIEDFCTALRESGYAPEDFDIVEHADPLPVSSKPEPETGTATVSNKKTGAERTYPIGHETTWPADFAQELKAGAFK